MNYNGNYNNTYNSSKPHESYKKQSSIGVISHNQNQSQNQKYRLNVEMLTEMAKACGKLNDVFVQRCLYWLAVRWNMQVAISLYNYLQRFVEDVVLDGVFELPTEEDLLNGGMILGQVLGRERIQFRYLKEKLQLHILGAGFSGSGKTNFAKVLIEQALINGVDSVKIIDPKSEYRNIAEKHSDFVLLKWDELRFNPFEPPPNVPVNEWNQIMVNHMAQVFNFWEGAESLFIRHLYHISKKQIPTISNLLFAIEKETPKYKQKDFIVMGTLNSRLEMLLYTCKDIVLSEKSILPDLVERHYIIQTSGLMSEIESWLVEFLLIWEYMYRIWNPDKRKLTLYVFDECQHRLFSKEKERNVKKIGSSIISMLVDQVRALNIGICSLSQEPSTLINAVLNNSWLKLAFHLGSGIEIKTIRDALGLTFEQAEKIFNLETGEAIVRMAGEYMNAFPVKINEFQKLWDVSKKEFEKHQKNLKQEIYNNAGLQVKDGKREMSDKCKNTHFRNQSDISGNYEKENSEERYDTLW